MNGNFNDDIREALAENAHDAWARWTTHLLNQCSVNEDGSMTIPPASVQRWRRQIATPYENLSAAEQESDLRESDRIMQLLAKTEKEPSDAALL